MSSKSYTIFYAKVPEWGVIKIPLNTLKEFRVRFPHISVVDKFEHITQAMHHVQDG